MDLVDLVDGIYEKEVPRNLELKDAQFITQKRKHSHLAHALKK